MAQINLVVLDAVLERYEARLEEVRSQEIYKWQDVRDFQLAYDPEASDVPAMLHKAFHMDKKSNLTVGPSYFPTGMLEIFAQEDPEGTINALEALFVEDNDIKSRMLAFESWAVSILATCNARRTAEGGNTMKSHYQDSRSMSVYLAFRHPESNYIYKTTMYTTACKLLGLSWPGNKFDKVIAYREMCSQIRDHILSNYQSLVKKSDALLGDLVAYDPEHRMLTQDVVYFMVEYDDPNDGLDGLAKSDLEEEGTGNQGGDSLAEKNPPYTKEDFLHDVYVESEDLEDMLSLLERKQNLILQGSPGTGKTFCAKRLAWTLMGEMDDTRITFVQFHQSTTYDDFVCGYRPDGAGGFRPSEGPFVRACDSARRDSRPHFFIIDEINRANVSKVLGELLMLIESEHRETDSVHLTVLDREFSVPSNLYIIGMMNTADRGLALIDYALRRRFAFFEMTPALENARFLECVDATGGAPMRALVDAVKSVNNEIVKDPSLGEGFQIGHSYFCSGGDPRLIFKYELVPLVNEYWFDDRKKAEQIKAKLKAALS